MKIVIFGCQQISVDFLKFLKKQNNIEISLVVSYELPMDKTYGYDSTLDFCAENNITSINPKTVDSSVTELIQDINPDIIFSIYYRKILPKEILEIPRLGCVNIHPSKLPYYRGPVPTAWMIQNGEREFGITIHLMDSGIDTGDILLQDIFKIKPNETGFELYTRAMDLGAEILQNNFDKIINQSLVPKKQNGIGSYYGKKSGKCVIDWSEPAELIFNKIRVHAPPFNPAETLLLNRYVLISKASIYRDIDRPLQGPGRIVKILSNGSIVVSCSDGYLLLEDYQFAPLLTANDRPHYLIEGLRFG